MIEVMGRDLHLGSAPKTKRIVHDVCLGLTFPKSQFKSNPISQTEGLAKAKPTDADIKKLTGA
jgi:hypothetical protein